MYAYGSSTKLLLIDLPFEKVAPLSGMYLTGKVT